MVLRLRATRTSKQSDSVRNQPAAGAAKQPQVHGAAAPAARDGGQQAEKPELLDELLIEEVSIDGMCGVY